MTTHLRDEEILSALRAGLEGPPPTPSRDLSAFLGVPVAADATPVATFDQRPDRPGGPRRAAGAARLVLPVAATVALVVGLGAQQMLPGPVQHAFDAVVRFVLPGDQTSPPADPREPTGPTDGGMEPTVEPAPSSFPPRDPDRYPGPEEQERDPGGALESDGASHGEEGERDDERDAQEEAEDDAEDQRDDERDAQEEAEDDAEDQRDDERDAQEEAEDDAEDQRDDERDAQEEAEDDAEDQRDDERDEKENGAGEKPEEVEDRD